MKYKSFLVVLIIFQYTPSKSATWQQVVDFFMQGKLDSSYALATEYYQETGHCQAFNMKGVILNREGKYDDALFQLKEGINCTNNDTLRYKLYTNLGYAKEKLLDTAGAVAAYNIAIFKAEKLGICPKGALSNIAEFYFIDGDTTRAIDALHIAVQCSDSSYHPIPLQNLARIYEYAGDAKNSLITFLEIEDKYKKYISLYERQQNLSSIERHFVFLNNFKQAYAYSKKRAKVDLEVQANALSETHKREATEARYKHELALKEAELAKKKQKTNGNKSLFGGYLHCFA